jgi:hypothetical protein
MITRHHIRSPLIGGGYSAPGIEHTSRRQSPVWVVLEMLTEGYCRCIGRARSVSR